jgi:hypothetical protein
VNADTFAEWLRRQGHGVVRTPSSYWYDAGPRVYQAFPYHWLIQPSAQEVRRLMLLRGIAALRYSAPLAATSGAVSYHVVLNGPYHLEMLRAQARNGVRRGLNHFQVERIAFERLAAEGWVLQRDTLERQGRIKSMSQAQWQRTCRAAEGLPGFEAWGAIHEGELAAALLTARIDDTCYVPYALSHSNFLREHVNNALFYAVSCDMLARDGVARIFFTLQSLDAPESVDDFKFRMSFTAKPVRQRVVFHPALRPLAGSRTHAVVLRLLGRHPDGPVLAKAEGMLRFLIQGKRPLDAQEWPACLAEAKAAALAGSGHRVVTESRPIMPADAPATTKGGVRHETA